MGRAKSELSESEKKMYVRERRKLWKERNQDLVDEYKRKNIIYLCYKRLSLPTADTIFQYNFQRHEFLPLFDSLFAVTSEAEPSTFPSSSPPESA